MQNRTCALIFARAPQLGSVKTRLARFLPPEAVLEIYRCMAVDVVCTVRTCVEEDAIWVCFHPPGRRKRIQEWLGDRYACIPQDGSNLGDRMKSSFLQAFQAGFSQAILVGTDLPDLPPRIIAQALSALEAGMPVIGPSEDGGYYLIGFNRFNFNPAIFEPLPWGSEDIFAETVAKLRKSKPLPHILPEWQDIDEYSDLWDMIERCRPPSRSAPHTVECLKKLGFVR